MRILYLTANPQWVELPKPVPQQTNLGDPPDEAPARKLTMAERRQRFRKYPRLELWKELRDVTDVLYESRAEGRVNFEVVPEVRQNDVVRYVGSRKPDVLHFSGHGEKGELILNGQYKAGESVSEDWFRGVLAGKDIDVLLLNCCWSSTIASAMEGSTRLAIGTTQEIPDDQAADFSRLFYGALQEGETLRAAYDCAREGREKYYVAFPEAGSIWDETLISEEMPVLDSAEDTAKSGAPIPASPAEPTPAQTLAGHQEEVQQLKSQLSFSFFWDFSTVLIAGLIALTGYLVLKGAFTEHFIWLALVFKGLPLIGTFSDLFSALATVSEVLKDASWLKWEPFAVMTTLASVPTARMVAWLWVFFGTRLADRSLRVVSTMPEEKIQRELATGRIELMLARLKEYTL